MANDAFAPEFLLQAYRQGVFPMSEGRNDPDLFWVDPKFRGIFPLDNYHISRSLGRRIRQENYEIRINSAFPDVMQACAERSETWISTRIFNLYCELAKLGHAHSLEVWQKGSMAGGVYGLTIGAAFFGESMFSRKTDGSKIALAYLIHRLKHTGFKLFDTQFITPHLQSLGAVEISRADYHQKLRHALRNNGDFLNRDYSVDASDIAQRKTQTS